MLKIGIAPIEKMKMILCHFMAKNDHSWFQKDNSWRTTTHHGGAKWVTK